MNASVLELSSERPRLLNFEGGCNFRDIGGYRTHSGRTVRWGKVYRTGVLAYFTSNDHPDLLKLGVRAICDLRRKDEREREPTRWPDPRARALAWHDGEGAPTIRSYAAERPHTAAGMHDSMIELYRALPVWMAARIRGMFESIAADESPLIVHCAAGKDRTGLAIAVLLRALDVPHDTVIEDYLLTNTSGDFERFIRSRLDAQLGLTDAHSPLLAMPPEMRRVLFSADETFLNAAFEVIEELGGFDAYLERVVQTSAHVRAKLHDVLLE